MENKKIEKKKKGFHSMNLNKTLLDSISSYGYKTPTPIQKKTIPKILKGHDLVGMARTGSGKTCCFVVPLLQKIRTHSPLFGIRGLIFAPNRELSIQTFTFIRAICRDSNNIRTGLIIGGESMDSQFDMLQHYPDIIVSTPGRFLHIITQADISLCSVEYVVFDEADKLFELGFENQMKEIVEKIPAKAQKIMFSATMPENLFGFVSLKLKTPEIIRLDSELKLSEDLKNRFFLINENDKEACLLYFLRLFKKKNQMTIVFCATKHQVEYLYSLIEKTGYSCAYVYGNLDQEHREDSIKRFKNRDINILLVTDIASRGLDVPMLDNVINYNFPETTKIFIHRVGRAGRQGRLGYTYSFLRHDELPLLAELSEFIGKEVSTDLPDEDCSQIVLGKVPQILIDEEMEGIKSKNEELFDLKKVMDNSMKMYLKTKKQNEQFYITKSKFFLKEGVKEHPFFNIIVDEKKEKLLQEIKKFRPNKKEVEKKFYFTKKKDTEKQEFFFSTPKESIFEDCSEKTKFRKVRENVFNICSDDPAERKKKIKLSKKEIQGKRLNESGKKIKGVSLAYKNWKKKTKNRIPKEGELENSKKKKINLKNLNYSNN